MDSIFVNLVAVSEASPDMTISGLLAQASPVVKGVLVLLVLMSLVSWYIIAYKYLYLRRAASESSRFLDFFWKNQALDKIYQETGGLKHSPVNQVYRAGYVELTKLKKQARDGDTMHGRLGSIENIERALRRARTAESVHLESMTGFLATTASAAPFVGLFGTVWGIMAAFINIAKKGDATLITVAPGIAEALIATAIGLVAAIPAVVFYNFFLNKMRVLEAEMENFEADFLNIVKRHFFK